jgi:type IV secretion system protein VirB5
MRQFRSRRTLAASLLAASLLLAPAGAPRAAGIPVIDVAAIAQLIKQVQYWMQQIQLMQNQLSQLQQTYAALSGPRGMQNLLAGTARNYLPQDWNEMLQVMHSASTTYAGLSNQVQTAVAANAVLSATQYASLTPQQRQFVDDGRSAAALLQVLSRSAYQNTSQRFGALQTLINAIARAGDMKAIADLQARVQTEQAMLQNEQTKLQTLYQAAQAQQWVQEQRMREASMKDIGSVNSLTPVTY